MRGGARLSGIAGLVGTQILVRLRCQEQCDTESVSMAALSTGSTTLPFCGCALTSFGAGGKDMMGIVNTMPAFVYHRRRRSLECDDAIDVINLFPKW